MSITLTGYKFSGPFSYTSSLDDRSGVYAILTPTNNNRYKVVDVGESHTVKSRVEKHERALCWKRNANSGGLRYAAHYTYGVQQSGRKEIEQKVRSQYNPPCGNM